MTTIKVDVNTRDRLKEQAAQQGVTLGQHLEQLMENEARRERFERLRATMEATPPDAAYLREASDWQGDQWG